MLINVITQARIEPYELFSIYPNTSWPANPSNAALEGTDYKVLNEGERPVPGENQKVVDQGSEERDGEWYIVYGAVDMTPEEIYASSPRVFEIQMRLPQIDPESVPLLRAVATGKATPEQVQKLEDLEEEFHDLTAELDALTPKSTGTPVQ